MFDVFLYRFYHYNLHFLFVRYCWKGAYNMQGYNGINFEIANVSGILLLIVCSTWVCGSSRLPVPVLVLGHWVLATYLQFDHKVMLCHVWSFFSEYGVDWLSFCHGYGGLTVPISERTLYWMLTALTVQGKWTDECWPQTIWSEFVFHRQVVCLQCLDISWAT